MSVLHWHRLSVIWKNWMFNQEPAKEPGAVSQTVQDETGNTIQDNSYLKTQNLDSAKQNSLTTEEKCINLNDVGVTVKSGPLMRSLSEPCSQTEVDNGSEGDDSFLQREGSQRRSRRRFRRINPRGERELITDGQEPSGYTKECARLCGVCIPVYCVRKPADYRRDLLSDT
ncbi:Rap guanine nucleotide exchange factor 6 PDZ domain-containing guanine nucleotide exchange factor 2 [Takifugu flavidus]|uniref:Rap guanine nucleotide exchange factor 6 PDZ domain-containing guanine nucleotide exchange factor 2 n=1 Tax=Takifugu flavidus TaxID=433684 RepID=A0A5C6P854_9TELE|nr:Rap guanine nucleotide exchange factor 6 PDZ domain-containing guanine nucleotide exchange factor 2 [Takifugu flavidus]